MRNNCQTNNLDLTNPAPRWPVIFLLNTSSGMDGAQIDELNEGLKRFIREIAADEAASRSMELEVISFGSPAKVIVPFTTIQDMVPEQISLPAGGNAAINEGIRLALRDLKAWRKMYRDCGISSYRPFVILMTDGGELADNCCGEQAVEELRDLGERGKIQYFGIEIGDHANHDVLQRILPAHPGPVKLKNVCFWQLLNVRHCPPASTVPEQDPAWFRNISDWGEL